MPLLPDPEAQRQRPGQVRSASPGLFVPQSFDRVRLLQIKLNQMGAQPPLVVDGKIGPKTQAAMIRFGIDVNGDPVPKPAAAPTGAPAPPAAAGDTAPPAAPAPAPAAGSDEDVKAKFGGWAWALDVPEVGDILRRAATEGWSDGQTQGAIQGTDWWKHTAAAGRNFQQLQGSDPAEAQAQILAKKADISQIAAQLGIQIADDRLAKMAEDSLRYGLDATGLQQMIGSEFHYVAGGQTGLVGQAELKLKQYAGDYMLPLSDDTLAGWEGQIAQGRASAEGYQSYMLSQAKSLYGSGNKEVTRLLDEGQTMQQIAQPFRDMASTELGVDPASIDFRDPKWMRAISTNDPESGERRMMNQWEWQRTIRGDGAYGWAKTKKAHDLADDFSLNFLQAIGKAPS